MRTAVRSGISGRISRRVLFTVAWERRGSACQLRLNSQRAAHTPAAAGTLSAITSKDPRNSGLSLPPVVRTNVRQSGQAQQASAPVPVGASWINTSRCTVPVLSVLRGVRIFASRLEPACSTPAPG